VGNLINTISSCRQSFFLDPSFALDVKAALEHPLRLAYRANVRDLP
jgi:hypothetical protein